MTNEFAARCRYCPSRRFGCQLQPRDLQLNGHTVERTRLVLLKGWNLEECGAVPESLQITGKRWINMILAICKAPGICFTPGRLGVRVSSFFPILHCRFYRFLSHTLALPVACSWVCGTAPESWPTDRCPFRGEVHPFEKNGKWQSCFFLHWTWREFMRICDTDVPVQQGQGANCLWWQLIFGAQIHQHNENRYQHLPTDGARAPLRGCVTTAPLISDGILEAWTEQSSLSPVSRDFQRYSNWFWCVSFVSFLMCVIRTWWVWPKAIINVFCEQVVLHSKKSQQGSSEVWYTALWFWVALTGGARALLW